MAGAGYQLPGKIKIPSISNQIRKSQINNLKQYQESQFIFSTITLELEIKVARGKRAKGNQSQISQYISNKSFYPGFQNKELVKLRKENDEFKLIKRALIRSEFSSNLQNNDQKVSTTTFNNDKVSTKNNFTNLNPIQILLFQKLLSQMVQIKLKQMKQVLSSNLDSNKIELPDFFNKQRMTGKYYPQVDIDLNSLKKQLSFITRQLSNTINSQNLQVIKNNGNRQGSGRSGRFRLQGRIPPGSISFYTKVKQSQNLKIMLECSYLNCLSHMPFLIF
ncbi:UNKNOWN [Stylonychia lemnae]|uniref:Uncharacterized protein n=1 Tax=Stylonychia lemnae TaxID=5949 RepID=A0A077ZPV4_STYLE|nr:UNKNOWN [Stylonychia lemnae]|eukprot:CDW71405.1 UNKNOWN [Stylonychia lemnae]